MSADLRRLAVPVVAAAVLAACAAPAPSAPAAPAAPAAAPAAAPSAAPSAPAPRAIFPPPDSAKNVELDNAADGTRVALARGAEVKILLDANPTTGFQWQLPANLPPELEQIGERIYVGKGADPRMVGAGGVNVFRFRGVQAGQAVLQLEYRRAWETGVPAAKTARYTIAVE